MTGPSEARPRPSPRFFLVAGILMVVAFLAGFGWQFLEARSARIERDALRTELTLRSLATTLAAATLQAERGGFESARELMSEFFSGLQANLDAAPVDGREVLRGILDRRDSTITALSRSEASGAATLARLFVQYQNALGRPVPPLPEAGRAEAPATGAVPDTAGGP